MDLGRLFKREKQPSQPGPQGEEREIQLAQQERAKERDRFLESLVEKAGHARYPWLKDPFD